jgi:hypothetical protein
MQAHGDTSVGIAGMDEVPGQVEVIADKCCKCVVGILVGVVRTPVGHGLQLLVVDWISEKGRVMTLDGKLKSIAMTNDVRLHTIASQDVLQLRREISSGW